VDDGIAAVRCHSESIMIENVVTYVDGSIKHSNCVTRRLELIMNGMADETSAAGDQDRHAM
jgi:hypothetical protein